MKLPLAQLLLPWKGLILGFLYTMLSNIFGLAVDYSLKLTPMHFNEIVLSYGVITFVGSVIVICIKDGPKTMFPKANLILILLYIVLMGVAVVTSWAAVKLMPLGDLVVIRFTTPLFTLILGRILNKAPVSIMKVICCLGILAGVVLVIQPPFLFSMSEEVDTEVLLDMLPSMLEDNDTRVVELLPLPEYPNYWSGFAMGLTFAILMAAILIIMAKPKQDGAAMELHHWMLYSGVSAVATSLVVLSFNQQNRLIFDPLALETKDLIMIGLAVATALKAYLILAACKVTTPLIVSTVRTLDIVMVLVIDAAASLNKPPNAVGIGGSILVIVSVVGVTFSEKLTKMLRLSCKLKTLNTEEMFKQEGTAA